MAWKKNWKPVDIEQGKRFVYFGQTTGPYVEDYNNSQTKLSSISSKLSKSFSNLQKDLNRESQENLKNFSKDELLNAIFEEQVSAESSFISYVNSECNQIQSEELKQKYREYISSNQWKLLIDEINKNIQIGELYEREMTNLTAKGIRTRRTKATTFWKNFIGTTFTKKGAFDTKPLREAVAEAAKEYLSNNSDLILQASNKLTSDLSDIQKKAAVKETLITILTDYAITTGTDLTKELTDRETKKKKLEIKDLDILMKNITSSDLAEITDYFKFQDIEEKIKKIQDAISKYKEEDMTDAKRKNKAAKEAELNYLKNIQSIAEEQGIIQIVPMYGGRYGNFKELVSGLRSKFKSIMIGKKNDATDSIHFAFKCSIDEDKIRSLSAKYSEIYDEQRAVSSESEADYETFDKFTNELKEALSDGIDSIEKDKKVQEKLKGCFIIHESTKDYDFMYDPKNQKDFKEFGREVVLSNFIEMLGKFFEFGNVDPKDLEDSLKLLIMQEATKLGTSEVEKAGQIKYIKNSNNYTNNLKQILDKINFLTPMLMFSDYEAIIKNNKALASPTVLHVFRSGPEYIPLSMLMHSYLSDENKEEAISSEFTIIDRTSNTIVVPTGPNQDSNAIWNANAAAGESLSLRIVVNNKTLSLK